MAACEKRKEPRSIIRSILFPIDGSYHCERAFLWYLENMKRDGDFLNFINILDPVYNGEYHRLEFGHTQIPNVGRAMTDAVEESKRMCRKYMEMADDQGLMNDAYVYFDSTPSSGLVKALRQHWVDVVIMGSRGRDFVRRSLLGSVSDHVAHHARRPVVIVPPAKRK